MRQSAMRRYSGATRDALAVLGAQIAAARRERRWRQVDLAERAGITQPTLSKVETGDPGIAIGTVFELAVLLGVPLFGSEQGEMGALRRAVDGRLALLPQRVRESGEDVDDEF